MEPFEVVKATGKRERFELSKLQNSLANAGAGAPVIQSVVSTLESGGFFTDGTTTKNIYQEAYRLLKKNYNATAGRYKLKQALFELGPTGFPFELLVAEVFIQLGYQVAIGQVVQGICVSHEIDVLAENENTIFMIECKFHNRKDHHSSIQTPLYIQSRFLDVKQAWEKNQEYAGKQMHGYIITNTRFTSDAISYAECMDLKLMSWDYPKKEGLKDLIERAGLYPITSLASLTRKEKTLMLEHKVVHCRGLSQNTELLDRLHFNRAKKQKILKELKSLYAAV